MNAKFLKEFKKKKELSRRLIFEDLINRYKFLSTKFNFCSTLIDNAGLKKLCQVLKRLKFLKDMTLAFVA